MLYNINMVAPVSKLKALADESRLRILHLLSYGYVNVQEITSVLELSQSTVSHHLKILSQADFIKSRKEGTWTYYQLNQKDNENPYINFLKNLFHSSDDLATTLQTDKQQLDVFFDRRRDRKRSFFDAVASEWSEVREDAGSPSDYINRVAELIPGEGTLIDLGCGSGALLAKVAGRSGQCIGVDFSQAMLDEARRRLDGITPAVDLRLGTLEHLPLGDASADCAVAYMVFHHIARPEVVLNDIFRALKPGSSFIISDLTEHSDEYMRDRYGDVWLGFNPEEFAAKVEEVGFTDVKIEQGANSERVFLLTCNKP